MKYQVEELTKQIKIEKTIHKILKSLVLTILGILLIINLIMFYQTSINPKELPHVGNISVLNIISESMEPTINVNDLIIIKKCNEEEVKEKDIITYKKYDESIVTHRIEKIDKENGKNIYTTKGDNNNAEDEEKIKHEQVYGKFLFKINGIGKLAQELQKNNGMISIILIIIIFVILKNSKDKKKETRKKIREKYEIKKKRDKYTKKMNFS